MQALITIGDIAMYAGDSFTEKYLNDTLIILDSAAKQSLSKGVASNNDDSEIYDELRNTLIECYTTVVNGVNTFNSKATLAKFAPSIIYFLQQSVILSQNRSLMRDVLALIGDIANCIGP